MRWPLRYQILVPLAGLTLVTVLAVSLLNAYLSARRVRRQIEEQLRSVARTLAESAFPLTDAVLAQTASLSGAELVLSDAAGHTLAASRYDLGSPPAPLATQPYERLALGHPVRTPAGSYFHAAVLRQPRSPGQPPAVLHLFYPEQTWRQAWRDAVTLPLAVGAGALVVAVLLAVAIAWRVTHPLRQLGIEVEKIARGDFHTIPLPRRNDELRDLAAAVDRMARMLKDYEQQVRRSERLRTLGQLGGGIAHQIRNSATGCRMALDLLARDLPQAGDSEQMAVAVRQLRLMEQFLGRLLALGRPPAELPRGPVDLTAVVREVLQLVAPAARHIHVQLGSAVPEHPIVVPGHHESLQQMLVNLVLNAIDAAVSPGHDSAAAPAAAPPPAGRVEVALAENNRGGAILTISDSGPGPQAMIAGQLFEPLVTDKPDGSGLGLTVAREIAHQHGGSVRWERRGGVTCFIVELPGADRPTAV